MKISIGAGDSIYVVSPLQVLTFSPQLKFVRSVRTSVEGPQVVAPLVMKGGEFILPKMPLRNDLAKFLRISPTGETKSFGSWSSDAMRCMLCSRQIIGTSIGANQFWAMSANAYEIQEWGADDRVVRHLSVANSPWFKAWGAEAGLGGRGIKPKTTFTGLF